MRHSLPKYPMRCRAVAAAAVCSVLGKLCAPQCPVVGACWGFMVLRVHTELSASHLESRLVNTAGCDVKVWWEEVCVCVVQLGCCCR